MRRMQRLLEGVETDCQSCLYSLIHMLEKFYGLCAYYYIFEGRLFPFAAARQLMEFLCSTFDESGILWWVGQI